MSIDIVALSCRNFTLVYLLKDYAFGAAIRIACGFCGCGDEGGRGGVRSAVKSGGCCAAKTTPPHKTFALMVLQNPLGPAKRFPKNRIDQSAVQAGEAAAIVDWRKLKRPEPL